MPAQPGVGHLFLYELDVQLEQRGFCALRFMDDVLVLTPTRWKLRRAVRLVNEALAALGLAKAPNKTYIGRIANGFSWLGYHLGAARVSLARTTWERFAARICRLYEHHAEKSRIGMYVQHWQRWVQAGLGHQVDGQWSIEGSGRSGEVLVALGLVARDSDWLTARRADAPTHDLTPHPDLSAIN